MRTSGRSKEVFGDDPHPSIECQFAGFDFSARDPYNFLHVWDEFAGLGCALDANGVPIASILHYDQRVIPFGDDLVRPCNKPHGSSNSSERLFSSMMAELGWTIMVNESLTAQVISKSGTRRRHGVLGGDVI
jgi:hypothetical protein